MEYTLAIHHVTTTTSVVQHSGHHTAEDIHGITMVEDHGIMAAISLAEVTETRTIAIEVTATRECVMALTMEAMAEARDLIATTQDRLVQDL